MKTVLMLSGGINSTYMLWKLASETKDTITAIFLNSEVDDASNLIQDYNIHDEKQSEQRCKDITKWISDNVRPIKLKTVKLTKKDIIKYNNGKIHDRVKYGFILSRKIIDMINRRTYDKFVASDSLDSNSLVSSPLSGDRLFSAELIREMFVTYAKRGEIEFPLMTKEYTLVNAITELPQELYEMVISCDNVDDNGVPCGHCYKCGKLKYFGDRLAQGKSVDEINTIVYKQCQAYGYGKWWNMQDWLGYYVDELSKQTSDTISRSPPELSNYKVE